MKGVELEKDLAERQKLLALLAEEIGMIADVGLRLVAQTAADGQIRANAPVILQKSAHIELADAGERRSAVQRELVWPAALSNDGTHRHAL